MNAFWMLALAATGAWLLFGPRAAQDTPRGAAPPPPPVQAAPRAEYRTLTPQEAKVRLDQDPAIRLVDVRTEAEYLERRLPNSLLIPDDEIATRAPTLLPKKDDTIFLYCRSGRRSRAAAMTLVELGYTNVYDVGGIIDWPYATVSGK